MLDSLKKNIKKATSSVSEKMDSAQFHLEKNYLDSKNSVSSTIDDGISLAKRTFNTIYNEIESFKELGISISLIVAPVPTSVFLAILWLKGLNIEEKTDEEEMIAQKKKYEGIIGLLKKYGKIPQTATIKNDYIEMKMDIDDGEVKGKVLDGDYAGMDLVDLNEDQIKNLLASAPDKETKEILTAWVSYQEKTKSL
jgi:hypothetical protein